MQETNKIVPSYMRNVSSILKIKEKLNKISWDVEGERVNTFHHFSYSIGISPT